MLKLGCHVSAAGKIYDAVDRATALGCNTMQIFARNPRQWRKASLSDEDIKIFKAKIKEAKISPVAIHIPYTLNLAAVKQSFYKITIREFAQDFLEADKLGAEYLVTHMGSYKGSTEIRGLLKIAQALKSILQKTEGVKTKILLENTSGSGNWLGATFLHQKFVLGEIGKTEQIGICLDTAHAWAAGYKIDETDELNRLLDEIDKAAGLECLKVIHLNDTREKLGSLHDRHCDIGAGLIGKRGMQLILNHPRLKNIPFILETPKESEEDDIRNLKIVRELYNN
ncbi:MAG: deoxyribonuclease IV [Candidatus Omnitrophota bacterium]|nr:deoxyribonuclease IV [Candidatus Omnitrophota bacterium]